MKDKLQKLKEQKEKIEEEIKVLENQTEFEEIKNFRIYKWENKPVGDFLKNMPKGYRLATLYEFNELLESGKYKLKTWDYHWVQHWNKGQRDKNRLSGVYLDCSGDLNSNNGDGDDSNDGGRVVLVKEGELE